MKGKSRTCFLYKLVNGEPSRLTQLYGVWKSILHVLDGDTTQPCPLETSFKMNLEHLCFSTGSFSQGLTDFHSGTEIVAAPFTLNKSLFIQQCREEF